MPKSWPIWKIATNASERCSACASCSTSSGLRHLSLPLPSAVAVATSALTSFGAKLDREV